MRFISHLINANFPCRPQNLIINTLRILLGVRKMIFTLRKTWLYRNVERKIGEVYNFNATFKYTSLKIAAFRLIVEFTFFILK